MQTGQRFISHVQQFQQGNMVAPTGAKTTEHGMMQGAEGVHGLRVAGICLATQGHQMI